MTIYHSRQKFMRAETIPAGFNNSHIKHDPSAQWTSFLQVQSCTLDLSKKCDRKTSRLPQFYLHSKGNLILFAAAAAKSL